MSLFWKDWLSLKNAVKRCMFNQDMRYQGMSFEQAQPYLEAEFNKFSVPDLEQYVQHHGLKTKLSKQLIA